MNEMQVVKIMANEAQVRPVVERVLASADAVEVKDNATLDVANQVVAGLSDAAKKWKDMWADLIADAKATYENARGRRDALLKPLEEAKEKVRAKISTYLTEQRRLKEEAEAKAFAEEQARIRRDAEIRTNLELAEMAEKEGADKKEVDHFLDKAADLEGENIQGIKGAPIVPKRPEMDNAHERVVYDFEIVEEGSIPRSFLMPNEKEIRAYIEKWKDEAHITGVRITKRIIPVMKRRVS